MQKSRRSWAGVRLLVAIAPAIALALNLGVWWGWSVAAVLMVAAVFGQAASQDFNHGTWMLIFTKKVKKAPYLLGRFAGAFIFSALLMLAILPGLLLGVAVVWVVDASQLTTHQTMAYLWPYVIGVWPSGVWRSHRRRSPWPESEAVCDSTIFGPSTCCARERRSAGKLSDSGG